MNDWLTRYNLRYPRTLVYMLQACEYNVDDYLSWYHRVTNFNQVERRKKLDKTPKAITLLILAWLILISIIFFAVYLSFSYSGSITYILSIALIIILPYILPYLVLIFLLLITFLQWPYEYFILLQTKKIIQKHPATRIAIAGSFGKTSFREILRTILSVSKKVAAPAESINTPLGIAKFIKTLTGDEEILIFELGEYYPGDIKKLCQLVKPDIGVITGINEAHFHRFKNINKTIDTIYELAAWLGPKPCYFNGESPLAITKATSEHIIFSRQGTKNFLVENPSTDLSGTSFTLKINDQKVNFHSDLLGLHQIGPLVAAIDIAQKLNHKIEDIQKGVTQTKPYAHRLEPKIDSSGVIFLDDSYNGNPDGVKAVIEFIKNISGHRRWYVTPGLVEMGSLAKKIHFEIGQQLAAAEIEKIILIKNSVTPFIELGLKNSDYPGEIIWFNDALTAYAALENLTAKNDIVLLQNDWPDQYY